MKHETIDYKTLKKIIKLFITIDVELGFYISCTQKYIVIDRWENKCRENQRLYTFSSDNMSNIITLVQAYYTLNKRKLFVG